MSVNVKMIVGAVLFLLGTLLILASLANATRIAGDTHKTIVQRNGYVIAAFTDGWLCYGEHGDVQCHRAIPHRGVANSLEYYIHEIEKENQ